MRRNSWGRGKTNQFGEVVIREVKLTDKNQLSELARACFEEDILHMIDQPYTHFAYTALLEDKIIGTVFAWENEFHPNCINFRIFVMPSIDYENIEKELFEVLMEEVKERNMGHLPLQTSIWETSVGLGRMYKKNDFKEMKRTYMPILEVDDVLGVPSEIKCRLRTVEEIALDEEVKSSLIQLAQRNYTNTHLDNPVSATIGEDVWEKLVFAEDLIGKGSYVYVGESEKEVLAYSLLHASDEKSTFELGWCGALGIEYEELISKLVQLQAVYARKHGIQRLLGEFDTTDEAAMGVLQCFPFEPCPTWITYSLNK